MENSQKIRILITNDDGVHSASLYSLAKEISSIAEVVVVAPDRERSGISQAFTCGEGLSLNTIQREPFVMYSVSGTPADCVKLAITENLCSTMPTLVLSGANLGENAGVSSLYSGTVAGAREACLWGVPAIALSLSERNENRMPLVVSFVKKVIEEKLFENMPLGTFWNVNFPLDSVSFAGVSVTTMGCGMFSDHYVMREGKYFLEGEKDYLNAKTDSDDYKLSKGFIVVTPHQVDQTSLKELERLQQIDFNLSMEG